MQAELIKLCNSNTTIINNNPQPSENSDLEKRVTKIENFLRAGNFVRAKKSDQVSSNQNYDTLPEIKVMSPPKPKYKGKAQDYWPKLVDDFKQNGKMLMYINLAGTKAYEVNDMQLEIDFPNGMSKVAKEFLSRPDTKQDLRETIHLAVGKEMQIKYVDENSTKENEQNEFEKFIGNNELPFNII